MSIDFEWKEEYSVNVQEIDQQHKQLVKLIFKLFDSINKLATKEKLGSILDELIKYTGYHFNTEEKYFDLFNYENKEEHINEHRKFVEKVKDFQQKYLNHEVEISFELIDFLEDWLLNHLMDSDKKYVKCFMEHGLK
jgi:hemerythrin-like metal-binding protein